MNHKIACIQINCQNNMQDNIRKSEDLIKQAADKGAVLIALPENAVFMPASPKESLDNGYLQEEHPALREFCRMAKEFQVWLLIGSLAIKISGSEKMANRSFLIDSNGSITEYYDKIHLYDAQVTGGESHQESKRYAAGNRMVVTKTPYGRFGMTICYDLRFPHLFRRLAKAGAEIIAVPSAFTKFTGQAHWHVLLRARAIETGCFIIAPAQTGEHPSGRKTFGHALIINPWGEIIAEAGDDEGFIIADVDTDMVYATRSQLASLSHDRDFE